MSAFLNVSDVIVETTCAEEVVEIAVSWTTDLPAILSQVSASVTMTVGQKNVGRMIAVKVAESVVMTKSVLPTEDASVIPIARESNADRMVVEEIVDCVGITKSAQRKDSVSALPIAQQSSVVVMDAEESVGLDALLHLSARMRDSASAFLTALTSNVGRMVVVESVVRVMRTKSA